MREISEIVPVRLQKDRFFPSLILVELGWLLYKHVYLLQYLSKSIFLGLVLLNKEKTISKK